MATIPTDKPVGSEDVRDLKFNSGKIDEFASSDNLFYIDRKGVQRTTVTGFEKKVAAIEPIKTYNVTPTDPDGTIAGLAGTPAGEMFRVVIQDSEGNNTIFNYYKNSLGVAEFVNSEASLRYIEMVDSKNKEPTALARNSLLYTGKGPVFPIELDKNNNVIFGYDAESDTVIGAGVVNTKNISDIAISNEVIEIVRQQIFLGTGIYPEILGRNNEVIFGYDSVNDTLVGSGLGNEVETLRLASQNAGISFIVPIQAVVNQTLAYGQSLAEGANGKSAKSVIQPYNNITFSGGPRENMSGSDFSSFIPLREFDSTTDNRGETVCSSSANYATQLAFIDNDVNPTDHVILSSTAGFGGRTIEQLSKGTDHYNMMLNNIKAGYLLSNGSSALQCMYWLQGEANSGDASPSQIISTELYVQYLIKLINDVNFDAKSITGQRTDIPFICYQHSSHALLGNIQLAFMEAQREDSRVFVVAPTYIFPHSYDNLHLDNMGYKWLGCYLGRAYKQLMFDRMEPDRIIPLGALVIGNKIIASFKSPTDLRFDTNRLKPTQDNGFVIREADGSVTYTIVSMIIKGKVVEITLATTPPPTASLIIRYALDYNGTTIKNGASGNLCDSTIDTVTFNEGVYPMFHICPHYQLPIIRGAI